MNVLLDFYTNYLLFAHFFVSVETVILFTYFDYYLLVQCAPLHSQGAHCTTHFIELSSHDSSLYQDHPL